MNIGYVFPWDIVGDPAAPERLAATGVDAIALAASYHSTRAATPFHPAHRVLEVPHSAFYLPVRRPAYGVLHPHAPTWTPPDAYLQARDALASVGLPVHAWTPLTHNTLLGRLHPELTVRNAFGDRYPHALCPSHEDVLDYCTRLISEIVELGDPAGLILEACGPMGVTHQSVHDKTAGADWSATQSALLSLCFCTACTPKYPDPRTQARVRTAIDTSATSMQEALGDLTQPIAHLRTALTTTLLTRLIPATQGRPLRLHASTDHWSTGSFAALPPQNQHGLTGAAALCWGPDDEATTNLARLAHPARKLGAYTTILPPRPPDPDQLARSFAAYSKAGADELHLYHLGLASQARLAAMTVALR
ncbi:hypothetical protein Acor_08540 [Acrocarpospora corrugata]|uniref:Alanine-rich protein n=1 Tax=Acrocarpospora corrugata TaxID=35763 RepID=A0A5M3VVN0_9ACTN|nr:hypothetical protein [Acrocarpospora corrugata]GER98790.1 hypothetical protein Acor_08540 [Acrocarpospora corrugata]